MSKSKYNKEPWHISHSDGDSDLSIWTNSCRMICRIIPHRDGPTSTYEEEYANMKLFSKAREMHEAIKEYLEWGPMTKSDREYHEDNFRKAIFGIDE
jgi:hypothetical protein